MATQADVRRIALSLPDTTETEGRFAFSVQAKGRRKDFAWVWLERIAPKKPRVPNKGVLAIRVSNLGEKDMMLSAEPAKFFTEPHYNGYPAVLVRLSEVSRTELKSLLEDAWIRIDLDTDGSGTRGDHHLGHRELLGRVRCRRPDR